MGKFLRFNSTLHCSKCNKRISEKCGELFVCSASSGEITCLNCYGKTEPEIKEMVKEREEKKKLKVRTDPDKIRKLIIKTADRNCHKELSNQLWKQTGFNLYVFAHTLFNAGRRFERDLKSLKKYNEKK